MNVHYTTFSPYCSYKNHQLQEELVNDPLTLLESLSQAVGCVASADDPTCLLKVPFSALLKSEIVLKSVACMAYYHSLVSTCLFLYVAML